MTVYDLPKKSPDCDEQVAAMRSELDETASDAYKVNPESLDTARELAWRRELAEAREKIRSGGYKGTRGGNV